MNIGDTITHINGTQVHALGINDGVGLLGYCEQLFEDSTKRDVLYFTVLRPPEPRTMAEL